LQRILRCAGKIGDQCMAIEGYDKDTEELSNQIAPNEYAKEYGNVYGCQYGQYGKSAICI
jgi:hypothetical protein